MKPAKQPDKPTIEFFTGVVAALFGIKPEAIEGWAVLVHNHEHGIGYIWSGESAEHRASKAEVRAMLTQALDELGAAS